MAHSPRFALAVRRWSAVASFSQTCRNAGTTVEANANGGVKPFEDIPRPRNKLLSYIDIFRKGGLSRLDEYFKWRRETFGPIWRENFGLVNCVVVADPVAAKAVTRAEGKYPRRVPVEPWLLYRKMGGYSLGVILTEGEDWQRHRSLLNIPLLRRKEVAAQTSTLNDVADDFVAKIRRVHLSPVEATTDMDDDLRRWSMEGMAATLFEKRLGLLEDAVNPQSDEFIKASKDLFEYTSALVFLPLKIQVKLNLPAWKGLRRAAKTLFDITEFHIREAIAGKEISNDSSKADGDGHKREIIPYLYASGKLSDGEILANATELFGASVDTTSNTMKWTLDLLAWNKDAQERLYREVSAVVPKGQAVTQEHLKELHYLKAVIRESMRLYPAVNGFFRILASDAVLCGYHVPAGTGAFVQTALMSRDPEIFEQPDKFMPERWLRSERPMPRINQFAAQPFSTGPRNCIGRRLAELEMQLCLAKIVQNFELESNNDEPLKIIVKLLQIGDKPLRLKFTERV